MLASSGDEVAIADGVCLQENIGDGSSSSSSGSNSSTESEGKQEEGAVRVEQRGKQRGRQVPRDKNKADGERERSERACCCPLLASHSSAQTFKSLCESKQSPPEAGDIVSVRRRRMQGHRRLEQRLETHQQQQQQQQQ